MIACPILSYSMRCTYAYTYSALQKAEKELKEKEKREARVKAKRAIHREAVKPTASFMTSDSSHRNRRQNQ